MSRILLCQIDGSIPNLALMRIAAHHRALGDTVELRHGADFTRRLWDLPPDKVYASCIFSKSRGTAERLKVLFPSAVVGGTGWDLATTLESAGIETGELDYTLYPNYPHSIGFTQRGCRLRCSFCVVPKKEGSIRESGSIYDIWRGGAYFRDTPGAFGPEYPRNLLLLDNDFFGQENWRKRIAEIRDGGFKVAFNQGINARFLTDEAAEAIASVNYRDGRDFTAKRIYTAWDNLKDEKRLFDGLDRLVKYGVKPDHIMVYVLIGYWPGETSAERVYRIEKLLEYGARPYPMPFVRTQELVGMQRWAMGAYAKRISWEEWCGASYRPEKLNRPVATFPLWESDPI